MGLEFEHTHQSTISQRFFFFLSVLDHRIDQKKGEAKKRPIEEFIQILLLFLQFFNVHVGYWIGNVGL